MNALVKALSDTNVVTWRNLVTIRRNPDWLVGATVQPAVFVLFFALVLGNALGGPSGGGAYREFMISGAFAQTIVLNSAFTTIAFANDLQKGVVERFRSLPMSRVALLLGRTNSDLVMSTVRLAAMSVCGLAVGWRIRGSALDAVFGYLVMLMFSFTLSWIATLIALTAPSIEIAQGLGLVWTFPVVYVSTAFVPSASLPAMLRPVADWSPLTAVANATRDLFGNELGPATGGWPAQHASLYAIICCAGMVALFAPLAVARYRRG